jgi:hypothetical protein
MAAEPDRIELVRSGGFANIPMRASVPASSLAPEERAAVEALREREPPRGAVRGAPDRFQYEVTVVSADGQRHSVLLGEKELDEPLRALVQRMEREAEPGG